MQAFSILCSCVLTCTGIHKHWNVVKISIEFCLLYNFDWTINKIEKSNK